MREEEFMMKAKNEAELHPVTRLLAREMSEDELKWISGGGTTDPNFKCHPTGSISGEGGSKGTSLDGNVDDSF